MTLLPMLASAETVLVDGIRYNLISKGNVAEVTGNSYGTLTFDELCQEACENTSIEPSIMRAAVTEYMKVVKRNVLKGFRVPVGDQFITVYPNLNVSVKDTKNQDGTVKEAATSKMVTASKGKSRLGASVSINFSKQFAMEVSWQKVDETGAAIEEEDITDGGDTGGGGTTPPSGEIEG